MSDNGSEATTRRVVVTGDSPLAAGLARGLAARGAATVVVAPGTAPGWSTDDTIACDFRSEQAVVDALDGVERRLGGIDQLVHAWVDPGVIAQHQLVDVDEGRWIAECQGSLEAGWWLGRHLSAPMRRSGGGSVVFVVPSIGLTGGAGHSMLATVAEGLRVLAKGCGRQWAQWGVTVNTVAIAPHHWVSSEIGEQLTKAFSLSVPAFGSEGDVETDLAPLVAAFADPTTHFLTAGTVVADGGLWMGL